MTASDYRFSTLDPSLAGAVSGFTFPAYRHMLDLAPTQRVPGEPEQRTVRAVAVLAWQGRALAGLGLAEAPTEPDTGSPEVLSLFVAADHRRHGVGTALLAHLENQVRAMGFVSVEAVYMTGKASIPFVERILARRGWSEPSLRTVTLRFTPEEASKTPWYGRVPVPRGATIFSWADLSSDELDEIRRSHEESPWVTEGLEPWRHASYGLDPVSSVGLRYRGRVVGWVINHRLSEDTVRFTCSFMDKRLSRRGRILPLYTESLERLRRIGGQRCMFVTPIEHEGMASFVRKRCAPWVGFLGETRGASKRLVDPAPGAVS